MANGIEKKLSYRNSLKDLAKDLNAMGKEANKANKEIDGLTRKLTKLFSIEKITSGIVKGIQKAVDYTEDLNLLSVAFGETANEAYNLSKNLAEITGFDTATLNRNLATFRNLTSTLGLTNEQADLLATNLEKMSLDVSSLYNVDLDRAAYALQGMLTGQPRTIKTLTGANVTNAALQETLTASGIDRKVSSLNSAEKAIIQYLTVEKQLINSNGDLARTLEEPQQLLRVFREQLTKAARSIGALFIPAIKAVIPVLTAILMVFNEIINVIAKLFGIDMDSYWNNMNKNTKNIYKNLDNIGSSASKAVKGLRAFDKLNVINTPSSSGSGASGLGISSDILKMLDEYDLKLDGIKTKATEIRDKIMEWLGFSKDVNGEWKWSSSKLLKNIYEWWKKLNVLGKTLVGLGVVGVLSKIRNIIKGLASTKIGTGISILAESIGKKGLTGTLQELGKVYPTISKMVGVVAGVSAGADGFIRLNGAINSISENGANITNITNLLSGLLEVIGGIAILVGSFTQNYSLIVKGIGAIAGALLLEFLTPAEQTKVKVDKLTESTYNYRKELEELENQIANKMTETYAQAARAEYLKDKLSELVDENGKIKGSHEEVEAVVKELNEILGTNYEINNNQLALDGKLLKSKNDLTKSVENYINKLKAEMLIEVSKEKIQKIYTRNLELKNQENKLLEELKESAKKYNLETQEGAEQFYKDNEKTINKLKTVQSELKTNSDLLDLYAQAAIKAEKGQFEEAERLITSTAKQAKISITDIYSQLDKVFDKNITTQMQVKLELDAKQFKKDLEKYTKEADKGLLNASYYSATGKKIAFASGGFPDTGSLFLAREAGPEMVGRIGSKTAVANNDQIVDAVAQGVASAIISTGGLNSRPIVIQASGDANGLMNFIKFKQQEDNMQYGN